MEKIVQEEEDDDDEKGAMTAVVPALLPKSVSFLDESVDIHDQYFCGFSRMH